MHWTLSARCATPVFTVAPPHKTNRGTRPKRVFPWDPSVPAAPLLPPKYWKNHENVVKFVKWVASEQGIRLLEEWYSVPVTVIKSSGGATILASYGNSLLRLLSAVYPEHKWRPWLFRQTVAGYFDDPAHKREYFDWLATKLNLKSLSDWYSVPGKAVFENGGGGLLNNHHRGSVSQALADTYPEHKWEAWKFVNSPHGKLSTLEDQRRFMVEVGKKLGINRLEDWLKIDSKIIIEHGGGVILDMYNSHVHLMLEALFPERKWHQWEFTKVPRSFWKDSDNQRLYLDWLGKKLNVQTLDDWYNIPFSKLKDHSGTKKQQNNPAGFGQRFLRVFGDSPITALRTVYPDHKWLEWKFDRVSASFWSDKENRKAFLDWAFKDLQLTSMADWYNIQGDAIYKRGGGGLLVSIYDGSLQRALAEVYPNHRWNEHQFIKTAKRANADQEHRRRAKKPITNVSV